MADGKKALFSSAELHEYLAAESFRAAMTMWVKNRDGVEWKAFLAGVKVFREHNSRWPAEEVKAPVMDGRTMNHNAWVKSHLYDPIHDEVLGEGWRIHCPRI